MPHNIRLKHINISIIYMLQKECNGSNSTTTEVDSTF